MNFHSDLWQTGEWITYLIVLLLALNGAGYLLESIYQWWHHRRFDE